MPGWVHSDPDADDGYWRTARRGSRSECARKERCTNPRIDDDGKTGPAWTRTVFCGKDMGRIRWALRKIPELYVELWIEIGEKPRRGDDRVSGSREAPVPVRLDVDALMREAEFTLAVWAERVRFESPAGLALPDTEAGRRQRPGVSLASSAELLCEHLVTLVTLPADMVAWSASLHRVRTELADQIDAEIITGQVKPGGWAALVSEASGADAGMTVLELYHRMRRALGLNAIVYRLRAPCSSCGAADIRQAQGDEYAECYSCHRLYNRRDYDAIAKAHRELLQHAG